jgi:hypothetical protein
MPVKLPLTPRFGNCNMGSEKIGRSRWSGRGDSGRTADDGGDARCDLFRFCDTGRQLIEPLAELERSQNHRTTGPLSLPAQAETPVWKSDDISNTGH